MTSRYPAWALMGFRLRQGYSVAARDYAVTAQHLVQVVHQRGEVALAGIEGGPAVDR